MLASTRSYADGIVSLRHLSAKDGLSDNRITSIAKDKEGFTWFATWAGINRFDGKNFVSFKSNPGDSTILKSDRIDEIYDGKSGIYIWAKVYDNHIYRFDKTTQQFVALENLISNKQFGTKLFSKILAVNNHQLWLKTNDGNIVVVDDVSGIHPHYREINIGSTNNNQLYFFHLDSNGQAWIANHLGLFTVRQNQHCGYTILKRHTKGNPFRTMVETKDGFFWLSDSKGGVTKFSANQKVLTKLQLGNSMIYGLKLGSVNQNLYCATAGGELFEVDQSNRKRLLAVLPDKSELYGIYEDTDQNLWIEAENYGAVKYGNKILQTDLFPKKKYGFWPFAENAIIFEDINKQLWVNLKKHGLAFYKKNQNRMIDFSLNTKELDRNLMMVIQEVFYDENGILWITTDNGGLVQLVLQNNLFEQHYIDENHINKTENEVRALLADNKDRLWVGTKSGRLLLYENGQQRREILNLNLSGGIHSVFQDNKGRFWVGTKGHGVFLIQEEGQKFKIIHRFLAQYSGPDNRKSHIYSIVQDKKNRIWIGTFGGGIVQIQESHGQFKIEEVEAYTNQYPEENFSRIRHLFVDRKGLLWIATTEGLVIYNPDSALDKGKFKIYRKQIGDKNSIGGNDVQYIYEDSKSNIWVLTSSGGLNRAVGDKPIHALEFENFSKVNGLSSDFLLSCAEDFHNNLWIATRNGFSKLALETKLFKNYSYYEGLQEIVLSEACCTRFKNGTMAFGNVYGFLTFTPKRLLDDSKKGNIVFTNFQINSQNIYPTKESVLKKDVNYVEELNLNYDQNAIALEFSLLGDNPSNKQDFVYKLEGLDKNWNSASNEKRIVYTNLSPGHYVLNIKSLSQGSLTYNSVRSLNIIINPPFWKTWWAYLFYTLLILAVAFVVRKVLGQIFRMKQTIAVEKRLSELKNNFFTQISHELRTPLTLILNPAEAVIEKEPLSAQGKDYMQVLVKNANRLLKFVNQLLDLRKLQSGVVQITPEEFSLNALIDANLGYFKDIIERKEIKVSIDGESESLNLFADKEKIEIVIYNLISNALKYSPHKGILSLHLQKKSGVCYLEISDQGPGVERDELDKIFDLYYEGKSRPENQLKGSGIGLTLAKELISLHGGKISATNIHPHGLKVTVEIPVGEVTDVPKQTVFTPSTAYNEELSGDLDFAYDAQHTGSKVFKKLLLVEDNKDLNRFLKNELSRYFEIVAAENGKDGLEKALQYQPDLILTDVMMPEMSGIELLDAVRKTENISHIPVVVLTAKNSVESQIEALDYGADYYLTKPFSMPVLTRVLSNLMQKRQSLFKSMLTDAPVQDDDKDEEENEEIIITDVDRKFLEKTIGIVEEMMSAHDFNIENVAETLGVSRSVFFRKFKSLTNLAPVEFVREIRLKKSLEIFDSGEKSISTVAYAVGFNNPKYFSTCFKSQFGMTPKEYILSVHTKK